MTTTAVRDVFITGLRNAHAMEIQARELMERQSERLDAYPDVKAKMAEHLQETNQQLKRLENCLNACGDSPSTLKDAAQSFMGNMMAMTHTVAEDEILKNTFANNAFENFEIAAYKSLIAMCQQAGMPNLKSELEASLREEQAMAKWVDSNVERITTAYLSKHAQAA
jgi:ferritin-like metal-binding protein YciE